MALDLPSYLLGKSKSGGGGTSDYSELTNKPSINGVTLSGNKTSADLGIETIYKFTRLLSYNNYYSWTVEEKAKLLEIAQKALNNNEISIGGYQETTGNGFSEYLVVLRVWQNTRKVLLAWAIPGSTFTSYAQYGGSTSSLFVNGFGIILNEEKTDISSVTNENTTVEKVGFATKDAISVNNVNVFVPNRAYNPAPKNYVDWSKYDLSAMGAIYWETGKRYIVGDKVIYGDKLYECNKNHTAYSWTSNYFDEIPANDYEQYHNASKKYVDDSIASAITNALGGNY